MSYWWKSSGGDVTRLNDDPKIAFAEFEDLYRGDPQGTFGVQFGNNCKLHISGEDMDEVFDTVKEWIDYVEEKSEG